MKRVSSWAIAFAAALSAAACSPYAGGLHADVANIQAKSTVSARRIRINQPLRIVLAKSTVQDSFAMEPAPSMHETFAGWRTSIHQALRQSFEPNFAQVVLSDDETRKGLELIVDRASFEKTHTIKFHVVLLQDGAEVVDVTGETEGRVVGSSPAQFEATVRTLAEEAIAKMCERVYDGVFRSQKLEDAGVWKRLEGSAASGS